LQIENCKLKIANWKVQIENCKLKIANWKVQIGNFIFPIFIFQLFRTFFDAWRPLTRGACASRRIIFIFLE